LDFPSLSYSLNHLKNKYIIKFFNIVVLGIKNALNIVYQLIRSNLMPTDTIDQNLRNVIQICYEMLEIADRGDSYRQDSGCGAVYGRLRDAAYKIRLQAEHELLLHEKNDAGQGGLKHKKS
jgi:hypothetical protein